MSDRSDASKPALRKLAGLQYLRALAALGVLLFHGFLGAGIALPLLRHGVDLFFLISGFLMVAITAAPTPPRAFLRDRIERIVPLYWLATLAMLGANAAVGAVQAGMPGPSAWYLIASFLLIPVADARGHSFPVLGPGWTLSLEMVFYILFSATLWLRRPHARVIVVTAILVMLVAMGVLIRPNHVILARLGSDLMLEFAMGAWIGLYWQRTPVWPPLLGWPVAALGCLLLIAPLELLLPRVPDSLRFGIPFALILIAVLRAERSGAMPRLPWAEMLGDASYSLYLWHAVIITVVIAAASRIELPPLVTALVASALSLVAGLFAYRLIERPLMTWFRARRHLRRRFDPIGRGAVPRPPRTR